MNADAQARPPRAAELAASSRDRVRLRVARKGVEKMISGLAVMADSRSYLSSLESPVELGDVRVALDIARRHLELAASTLKRIEHTLEPPRRRDL